MSGLLDQARALAGEMEKGRVIGEMERRKINELHNELDM